MSSIDLMSADVSGAPQVAGCEPVPVRATWRPATLRRSIQGYVFFLVTIAATLAAIGVLFYLLRAVVAQGAERLSMEFLTSFPSRFAAKAGIKAALYGSSYLAVLTAAIGIPIGVGAGVYLEEFAAETRVRRFIDVNVANLAGVPSIVYGMLGLTLFVRWLGLERSLLAGALTMSMLILPMIVVTTREALKTVPESVRLAAYGLGATKWQAVRAHVLPAAAPGILTGLILALSRAAGETAPLLVIGALSYMAFVPTTPFDAFTVLPIQIFNWTARPQEEFHVAAAAGIIVLLALLLTTNAIAIILRHRFQRKMQW